MPNSMTLNDLECQNRGFLWIFWPFCMHCLSNQHSSLLDGQFLHCSVYKFNNTIVNKAIASVFLVSAGSV